MKKPKILVASSLIAVLLLSVMFTSVSEKTSAHPFIPPREETLVLQMTSRILDPTNFNWLIPGVPNVAIGRHNPFTENFWTINLETGEIIFWLAESFEFQDNYTRFIIHLRRGVKWSDGVPFTADDVVFTYNLLLENAPKLLMSQEAVANIKSVRKIDDYTVEFELNEPNPRFYLLNISGGTDIGGGMCVVPKHVWEGKDPLTFKGDVNGTQIVTGPYEPLEATETYRILVRRDDWWATEVFGIRPAPKYIMWKLIGGTDEEKAMALATNEIDIPTFGMSRSTFEALRAKNPYVRDWSDEPPYGWKDSGARYLGLNWAKYPWNIPEVRKALSYYIDREAIVDIAWEGCSEPSWQYWPTYAGIREYLDHCLDLKEKHDAGVYDPAKGDAILESLGWHKGPDGIWITDNGTRVTLEILTINVQDYPKIAMVLADQLTQHGIETTHVMMEWVQWEPKMMLGDFEATVIFCPFGDTDPFADLDLLHSRNYVPVGEMVGMGVKGNYVRYRNPEFDKLVDELRVTSPIENKEKCIELFREIMDKFILTEYPLGIPLTQAYLPQPVSTYYWTGFPSADNPYIHWPAWWASFLHVVIGYPDPETGEWIGGIRPREVDYTTVYFTENVPRFRGIDLVWYGPFKAGDAARIPVDDAEYWIRKGKASYTPQVPGVGAELQETLSEISNKLSGLEETVNELADKIEAIPAMGVEGLTNLLYATIVLEVVTIIVVVVFGMRKTGTKSNP